MMRQSQCEAETATLLPNEERDVVRSMMLAAPVTIQLNQPIRRWRRWSAEIRSGSFYIATVTGSKKSVMRKAHAVVQEYYSRLL